MAWTIRQSQLFALTVLTEVIEAVFDVYMVSSDNLVYLITLLIIPLRSH